MSRTVKALAALLFVSVAANLAAGGYLLVRAFDDGRPPRFERVLREGGGERLSPPARAALEQAMTSMRPQMRAAGDEFGEARREVGEALATDPLDAARIDAAFARLRAATEASQTSMHGALSAAVAGMSAEERRHFIEHWRHSRRGGGPRQDGPGPR